MSNPQVPCLVMDRSIEAIRGRVEQSKCGANAQQLGDVSLDRIALMYSYDELMSKCNTLEEELTRLRQGKFTTEELNNLCHNLSTDDLKVFKEGCLQEQAKLFGPDKIKELEDNKTELIRVLIEKARDCLESIGHLCLLVRQIE